MVTMLIITEVPNWWQTDFVHLNSRICKCIQRKKIHSSNSTVENAGVSLQKYKLTHSDTCKTVLYII